MKKTAIKKPIPVEFIKLNPTEASIKEVYEFITGCPVKLVSSMDRLKWGDYCDDLIRQGYYPLKTLESGQGTQNANFGDYILKGIDGECWPVKANIFERTYDIQDETKPVSQSHPTPTEAEINEAAEREFPNAGMYRQRHGFVTAVQWLQNYQTFALGTTYTEQASQPNPAIAVIEAEIYDLVSNGGNLSLLNMKLNLLKKVLVGVKAIKNT